MEIKKCRPPFSRQPEFGFQGWNCCGGFRAQQAHALGLKVNAGTD